jgi:hypothetical protein
VFIVITFLLWTMSERMVRDCGWKTAMAGYFHPGFAAFFGTIG